MAPSIAGCSNPSPSPPSTRRPTRAAPACSAPSCRKPWPPAGPPAFPPSPAIGLSESFVDPALAWLAAHGATIRLGSRVTRPGHRPATRVTALGDTPIGPDESVILATPATVAAALLPGLVTPDRFEAILNVHYRIDADPAPAGFIGLVGGTAEWVFIKPGIVSVTISAANRAIDTPPDALAQQVWQDVRAALGARLQPCPPIVS